MSVWQHYRITTTGDCAIVHAATNDDNDDGYDDGYESQWELMFLNVEDAITHTGRSRVGVSGVVVTVWLDGERI